MIGRALQGELHVDFHEESEESAPTENVVRLCVVLESFQTMMAASVSELRRAGLVLDTFGFDNNLQSTSQTALPDPPHKPLSCPVTVLCNDIQIVMKKLQYAVYRGEVYKLAAKSQFTFHVGDSPSSQASTMPTVHERGMPEEELRNILSVSLIDEEVDETAQGECSQQQSGGLLTEPQS